MEESRPGLMSDTIQSTKNGNSLRMLLEITGKGLERIMKKLIGFRTRNRRKIE